ncbi:hypothetical protein V2A60_008453 [Cordyceps javanica]
MAAKHAYQSLEIPSSAPFELKPSPGKGWGAFATQKIKEGSVILAERPLFIVRKHPEDFTLIDIRSAIQALTAAEKKVLKTFLPQGAALSPFTVEPAFAENSFNIGDNTSPARGFFVLHSRFNHSCLPNCKIPDSIQNDTIVSIATRSINAGEEMFFCYEPDFEARTAVDRLVRGLDYLIQGVDIDGKKQIHGRPLIVDLELKQAAERRELKLSSLFFYYLLSMALLESEGLLDQLKTQRLMPCIQYLATLFQTPFNAAIASRAMKGSTAVQRLFIAAGLYGKLDAFDRASALRQAK